MDAIQPGTVLDRYTVEAEAGRGAMAVVYRVRHNRLGTVSALKVLTLVSVSVRDRLIQEGRVQAELRHPNILSVTDVIDVHGAPGLVMEYIDGPDLATFLERHQLTFEQADELAGQILDAVSAAHDGGFIHRDLKPGNIMLDLSGGRVTVKVADFGLVKLLDDGNQGPTATRTGAAMGTPAYMAPEQLRDAKNVDGRADVFSLGAILYEMVCGVRAFNATDLLELFQCLAEGRFAPPRDLVPDLPERYERAILGALKPNRDERIGSVEELRRVWRGADRGGTSVWGDVLTSRQARAGRGSATQAAGGFAADAVQDREAAGEKATFSPSMFVQGEPPEDRRPPPGSLDTLAPQVALGSRPGSAVTVGRQRPQHTPIETLAPDAGGTSNETVGRPRPGYSQAAASAPQTLAPSDETVGRPRPQASVPPSLASEPTGLPPRVVPQRKDPATVEDRYAPPQHGSPVPAPHSRPASTGLGRKLAAAGLSAGLVGFLFLGLLVVVGVAGFALRAKEEADENTAIPVAEQPAPAESAAASTDEPADAQAPTSSAKGGTRKGAVTGSSTSRPAPTTSQPSPTPGSTASSTEPTQTAPDDTPEAPQTVAVEVIETQTVALRILADPFDGVATVAGRVIPVGSSGDVPTGVQTFEFKGDGWSQQCTVDVQPGMTRLKFTKDSDDCKIYR